MLRASAEANGESIDLLAVGDETRDVGLPGGRYLSALAEAVVLRDNDELFVARQRCVDELGQQATDRAVAVAANFEMMNRLLDAIGVGPSAAMRPMGELIGVPLPDRFAE